MAKIIDMPKLSPTMEEGRLATWRKNEGDAVDVDTLLAEVETDKATMEFRSFDKGTLLKLLVTAGSMVVLGQPVAILGRPGEDISALLAQAADASRAAAARAPAQATAPAPAAGLADARAAGPARDGVAAPAPATIESGRVNASPYVRKLAREQGLDLRALHGSGPHGRIVQRDLEGAAQAGPDAPPPAALAEPERHPLSMMRKTIARRLTESKRTVPHFYLTVDLDVGALVALRETIHADLAASPVGPAAPDGVPERISLNDLLVKACALALRAVPACNASFTPEAILVHRRVDISVAVALEDGLVTPVVHDADRKGLRAISSEIRGLAARARDKKLRPEELTGGTFSISNLGMLGVDSFAAVINPPEGAILAVGRVREEPVVRGSEIVVGRRLACTLACDHRVVDGAVGAAFLAALRVLVEHPTRILV